jgi:hypothetical protein
LRESLRALIVLAALVAFAAPSGAAKRKGARTPEKPAEAARTQAAPDAGGEIKRGERIEFDERLIQGQTAKAGAIYLFDRKPNDLRSMVHERESYRDEIVREIFPEQEGTP